MGFFVRFYTTDQPSCVRFHYLRTEQQRPHDGEHVTHDPTLTGPRQYHQVGDAKEWNKYQQSFGCFTILARFHCVGGS